MGLMSEWRAFGAFAVEYLGMPAEAMPLYDGGGRWKRKAEKILRFVMSVGNFGHNRDMSYYRKYPYVVRKVVSFGQRVGDVFRHVAIFPLDSFRFLPSILFNGLRSLFNTMKSFELKCTFHPVGQGAFYAEVFSKNDVAVFSVVFDCGTGTPIYCFFKTFICLLTIVVKRWG